MRLEWVRKEGHQNLIIFFAGWQIGSEPLAHLQGEYDVLFVDLLDDAEADWPELEQYKAKFAVAFSFGVAAFAAWQARNELKLDRTVAINGTLKPVDRAFGIPPIVMQKTIETLSENSFQAFLVRCFGAPQVFTAIHVEKAKAQLQAVQATTHAPKIAFDLAWVSNRDKIFPPQNQKRFWNEEGVATLDVDSPHVPFAAWQNWDEVLYGC